MYKTMNISSNNKMDAQIFTLSNTITLFLISATLLITLLKKQWEKTPKNRQKLPPGPFKLPFIGCLHLLGYLPHQSLARLAKKHGHIMHLQLGEVSAIVVSSPQMAKEITRTHDLSFASRPRLLAFQIVCYGQKDIAFSPYGDYWRQMRKICIIELLSSKNVRSFADIRRCVGSELVETVRLRAGKTVNLTEAVFGYQAEMVSRAAFGKVPRKQQEEFVGLMKQVRDMAAGFDIADLFPSYRVLHSLTRMESRLVKVREKMDLIFEDILRVHLEEGRDEDLVDALLRVKRDGDHQVPISNDDIKAIIFDMFAAGTETSTTTVDWLMSELIRHPKVMAKAQQEIRQALKGKQNITEADIVELKYLKLVIKETMRIHPPFPLLLPRESREECEVAGYTIPAKTKVMVNTWAIGRNPEFWENAERFKPERFEGNGIDFNGNHFEFLPFGSGRRSCPGMSFGLANVELPVALLLHYFDWKLPNGANPQDLDMLENPGITASRRNNLNLVPSLA